MYHADLHECTVVEICGARLGRELVRGAGSCVSA